MVVRRTILLLLAAACVAGPAASADRSTVWGVTLDNDSGIAPQELDAQVDALASLPKRPTARVVIDYGTPVSDYARSIPALSRVADLVGQLADSSEVRGVSTAAYRRWAQRFVDAYRGQVSVWEIGNEVNGEWVGTPAQELARINAANEVVRAAGGRTMLTLYYNPNCWAKPQNELFTWLAAHRVPAADYVTISYYPHDCNGYWPSAATWQRVFDRLHARFPHALLAFGESGGPAELLQQYASVRIRGDNFVGGYFWWTWAENAVPKTNAFWLGYAAAMR